MNTEHRQNHFTSRADKHQFFYQSWEPEKPLFHVVIVHGALEHSGRYQHITKELNDLSLAVHSMDLRGHGRDSDPSGNGKSIKQNVADIREFLLHLQTEGIQKPLLIGHSMGGLISLQFVRKQENRALIRGLITSGAAIDIKYTPIMKIKEALGRLIIRPLIPKLTLPLGLNPHAISHDENEVNRYVSDPYVIPGLAVDFALDIVDSSKELRENAQDIADIPLLMTHGEDDSISYSKGTKDLFEDINCTNKSCHIFPGLFHEIFNERIDDRVEVFKIVREWISQQFMHPH